LYEDLRPAQKIGSNKFSPYRTHTHPRTRSKIAFLFVRDNHKVLWWC
jgi:hypothetical protein